MKKVYFIKPVGLEGPIKIGCSRWPEHRLADLAKWSPIPLEIMASGPGEHVLERFIHRMFKDVRSHKEWFHSTPALLARIDLVRAGKSVATAFDAVPHTPKGRHGPAAVIFKAAPQSLGGAA